MANQIRIQPEDPEAARAEIERTRARMSATIDELEVVLIEQKEKLRERLDFAARVRENPTKAAGIVFGVGLLLGFLTGGGDEDEEEDELALEQAAAAAALWETRARRLLGIARAQEDEIESLEESAYEASARAYRAEGAHRAELEAAERARLEAVRRADQASLKAARRAERTRLRSARRAELESEVDRIRARATERISDIAGSAADRFGDLVDTVKRDGGRRLRR